MFESIKSMIVFVALILAASTLSAQEMRSPLTYIVVVDISYSMEDQFAAPIQAVLSDSSKLQDVNRRVALLAKHVPAGTRVIVTTFDHRMFEVCDLKIDNNLNRQELIDAFASIKGKQGSTFLWSTLDKKLTQASEIIDEFPEGRVRVLLYSDGQDEEKNPEFSHQDHRGS